MYLAACFWILLASHSSSGSSSACKYSSMRDIQLDLGTTYKQQKYPSSILWETRVSWIIVLLNPIIVQVASLDKRHAFKSYLWGTFSISKEVTQGDILHTFCVYLISWGSFVRYCLETSLVTNLESLLAFSMKVLFSNVRVMPSIRALYFA